MPKILAPLILIVLFISLIGCTNITQQTGTIEFSATRDGNTGALGERTNIFKIDNAKFYFATPLSGNTAKYEIIFEKNDAVFWDDKDKINVSPDWISLTGSYMLPYEEGKYTIKIFNIKEEKLVSKGELEVVK